MLLASAFGLYASVRTLLAETPHNWIAMDAVLQVAQDRQIPLPAALNQQIDAARAADDSWSAQAMGCAAR